MYNKYIYLHIKNTLKLTGAVERSFAFSMANLELFEGLMLCKSDSWDKHMNFWHSLHLFCVEIFSQVIDIHQP